MKKFKFPLAIILILIAIGGVFAFTAKKANVKRTYVIYHYTSNSAALVDMKDTSNWEINATPDDCFMTGELPCTKQFDGDWSAFITYLNSFNDPSVLAGDADSQKSSK